MKESGKILKAPITRIFLNDTNMKRKISKGYLIGFGVMEDQLMCVQVVATITRHGFHRPLVTSGHNINIHAFIGIGLERMGIFTDEISNYSTIYAYHSKHFTSKLANFTFLPTKKKKKKTNFTKLSVCIDVLSVLSIK